MMAMTGPPAVVVATAAAVSATGRGTAALSMASTPHLPAHPARASARQAEAPIPAVILILVLPLFKSFCPQ
jgi:hypothetical protein